MRDFGNDLELEQALAEEREMMDHRYCHRDCETYCCCTRPVQGHQEPEVIEEEPKANLYGVRENNPLPKGYKGPEARGTVYWTDKNLARITRLRLVSDPGFPMWDVSYCWGVLKDGTEVEVSLPFSQLDKTPGRWNTGAMQKDIIRHARRDRVYAKGLGIFSAISTLN